ncbi:hypothetical protein GC163_13550 [bacterium]|nr:hypothetical protein [bacterium]
MPKPLNARIRANLKKAFQKAVLELNREHRRVNPAAGKTHEKVFAADAIRAWLKIHSQSADGCSVRASTVRDLLSLQYSIPDELKNELDSVAGGRSVRDLPGGRLHDIVEAALQMWLNDNGFDENGERPKP